MPTKDAAGYDYYAVNIVDGKGLVNAKGELTSWREPIYPYFLSYVYRLFGHSYLAVRVIQATLGALTCVIIFMLAYQSLGIKTGIISALIFCFYPISINLSGQLSSENIFTFLLALAMLFFLRYIKERYNLRNLIYFGFILGLVTLTRSVTLCFPLFILLFSGKWAINPVNCNTKRYLLTIFIFIFFFILPIAPWTMRNWIVHHRFIPVVTRTGLGLYSSFVPKDGKIFGFNADDEITNKSEAITPEAERSDFLVKETIKYITNNPHKLPRLEILKAMFFWSPFDWDSAGRGIFNFVYAFILPFFILSFITNFKNFFELLTLYLPIIYFFIFALLTFGIPRFRFPIEPYIIIIAAAGIERFLYNFREKIYKFLFVLSYFFLNLWVYFNCSQAKMFLKSGLEKFKLW